MVDVLLGRRANHVEVVLGGHVLAQHVTELGQDDETVLRAVFEVEATQCHSPVGVRGGGIQLLALGVQDHHGVGDGRRVEIAVEGHLHRVRLHIHVHHLGALAECPVGPGRCLVDQELLAGRFPNEAERLLVVADIDLAPRQDQANHEPRRVGL